MLATVALLAISYLFAVGFLLEKIEGVELSSVNMTMADLLSAVKNNLELVLLLSVPAVYCSLVFLSLLYHKDKLSADGARNSIYLQTEADRKVLDENKLRLPTHSLEVSYADDLEATKRDRESTDEVVLEEDTQDSILIERLKTDLAIAEQEIKKANKSKSQFLANISHELRTPMNGILGMTELLMGTGLNHKQMHYGDSVRRSAESLLSVINDLLDYSKMEAGGLYLEKASFNIRELVEDVCDLLAVQAQLKELELICHIDRSMHEQVIGDANRIRQILSNLISNAIKFTKRGEIVVKIKQIEYEENICTYRIDVVDTGIGISPEGQAKIFDSFTQADSSDAREHGGSGLGLFISHKLLELMQGSISLRSRMDEGSHFAVTLQLKTTESESQIMNFADTLQGVRVLVVDDNETNRTILFHQLKTWGVYPETVESADKALEKLIEAKQCERPFEVAILDYHMPGTNGIELARRIQNKQELSSLKRLMLTSATLDMSEEDLSEIGITQYISKPARQTQLYNALSGLVPHVSKISNSEQDAYQSLPYKSLGLSVLLAEDNIINQEVAQHMLVNFGCNVEVVANGQAALDICEKKKFDVIMMDCLMPVLSGVDATMMLRNSNSLNAMTPVVALTANVSSDDEEQCYQSGMNDYICKPVKQDELYRRLSRWIHHETVDGVESDANVVNLNVNASFTSKVAQQPDCDDTNEILVNITAINNIRQLQRPGKPDLLDKVLTVYFDKSPALLSSILSGVKNDDFDTVKDAAHSMKSSSAYVGADQLAEQFRKIEHAAADKRIDDLAALTGDIQEKYDRLSKELESYRNRAA